jgi:hypothetical protein
MTNTHNYLKMLEFADFSKLTPPILHVFELRAITFQFFNSVPNSTQHFLANINCWGTIFN